MSLAQFQGGDTSFQMMQNSWATQLNPVLSNPLLNGSILPGVVLSIGTTKVSHLLGRKLQGWIVVGQNAPASIYDSQATESMPFLFLSLVSNATVTVTLWVF